MEQRRLEHQGGILDRPTLQRKLRGLAQERDRELRVRYPLGELGQEFRQFTLGASRLCKPRRFGPQALVRGIRRYALHRGMQISRALAGALLTVESAAFASESFGVRLTTSRQAASASSERPSKSSSSVASERHSSSASPAASSAAWRNATASSHSVWLAFACAVNTATRFGGRAGSRRSLFRIPNARR